MAISPISPRMRRMQWIAIGLATAVIALTHQSIEGETPSAVIASYGFSRTSIHKWLARGGDAWTGPACLAGTPGAWSAAQSDAERRFGVRLGLTAIGELLAKLNLMPQKPLQRAYQRDPVTIERWRRESYPAIARQAKAEGGEVFFWFSGERSSLSGGSILSPWLARPWG